MTKQLASFALLLLISGFFVPMRAQAACTTSKDCPATQACINGVCKAPGASSGFNCTSNAACGTGKACVSGFCRTACTNSTMCAKSEACVSGGCISTTQPTSGATGNPPHSEGQTLQNPLKVNSLTGLLDIVLSAVIELGSIVLVLMLIWVGFMFVTSRGNPENISKARTALIWTIIGGLILLGAKGIETVISSTVNNL